MMTEPRDQTETIQQRWARLGLTQTSQGAPPPAAAAARPGSPVKQGDPAARAWLDKCVQGCLAAVREAPEGTRNAALNAAAFKLGRFVPRWLEETATAESLYQAAREAGLEHLETAGTVRSGLSSGQRDPRDPPVSGPYAGLSALAGLIGITPTTARLTPPTAAPEDDRDDSPDPADPDAAVLAAHSTIDDHDLERFWQARAELAHLHTYARSRMCSPWAVFGVALLRVLTVTPPFVVLPPLVGGVGSLNSFIALVGRSGAGKGSAERCAADALHVGDVLAATVGSGEGIPHLYAHREKGAVVRDRDAVLFTVPEIDTLAALGSRQGATLLPQLRSAWSGEQLGFSYADPTKRLPIAEHSYRMTLSAGVQPGRAGALLDDADGGTPQRFLWLPTSDPHAPDTLPDTPPPLEWQAPRRWPVADQRGLVHVQLPDVARELVIGNRKAQLRGEGDALDGHALQARLKVAAALALLDRGRVAVSEQDWELAATVMAVSDATRTLCVQHLAGERARANTARAVGEGQRAVIVADQVAEAGRKRVANVLMRRLRRSGDWMARGELRRALASPDRGRFEDALDALEAAGQVVMEDRSERSRVRATTTQETR